MKDWSTTAADNDTAGSINFAEGQLPSTVNNSARQLMADVREWFESAEWINLGHTVTYATATTFTIATDVTATYAVNRRIKCTDASTLYGTITASSYSAPNTTVTVTLDSGSLSASLTAVFLGILTASNQSLPPYIDSQVIVRGSADGTKRLKFEVDGLTTATTRTITIPDANTTLVGTDATQTLTNKTISGGSITGITDLAVADGGTGASTAAAARANLGITDPSACLLTGSSTQSIPATTYTALNWDTEIFDTNSLHSTVSNTSRITVPSGATYGEFSTLIKANLSSTTYSTLIALAKNGTALDYFKCVVMGGGGYPTLSISTTRIPVTPGDYYEILVYHNYTAAIDMNLAFSNFGAVFYT